MDSVTDLIKKEIKRQYRTVNEFSKVSGIPYSTLTYALSKGVGSTSYDTVVKMCSLLHIKQLYDEDIVLFSQDLHSVYKKLSALDDTGIHTVCTVLDVEYERCTGEKTEKTIRGYNGIGYAKSIQHDEERIKKLIEKVKQGDTEASSV